MADKLIGLTPGAFGELNKLVRVGRVLPPLDPRSRRVPTGTPDSRITRVIDNGPCGCCDSLKCIDESQATVTDCDACPNGAAEHYWADLGEWVAFPTLGGRQYVTYTGSGCTWEGRVICIVVDDVCGCYKWRMTIDGEDSAWELVFVRGTDVLEILPGAYGAIVHQVKWSAVKNWSCRCRNAMKAVDGEFFPEPDGLLCNICVVPFAGDVTCNFSNVSDPLEDAYIPTADFAITTAAAGRYAVNVTNFELGHYTPFPENADCAGWYNWNLESDPSTRGVDVSGCGGLRIGTKIQCCETGGLLAIFLFNAGGDALASSQALYTQDETTANRWNLLSVSEGTTSGHETISEYPEFLILDRDPPGAMVVTGDCSPAAIDCGGAGGGGACVGCCRYVAFDLFGAHGAEADPLGPWTWGLFGGGGCSGCIVEGADPACGCPPPPDDPPTTNLDVYDVDCAIL